MAQASTLERDALLPRRPGGLGRGATLALLAHAALILGLTLMLNWRSQEPEGVTAELWAALPQFAAPQTPEPKPEPAPPPPQPAPPPPKTAPQANAEAEIALAKAEREKKEKERARVEQLEREKKEKLEKERLEKERKDKLAKQRKEEEERKAEEARQAKQREDNLKRMLAQAGTGTPSATGTAVRDAGPSAGYAGRIKARIKPNIVFTDSGTGNPTTEVEVRCAADGTIIGKRVLKSSGNAAWDDAVIRAIEKTEVLPRDIDGRVPSPIILSLRPRE